MNATMLLRQISISALFVICIASAHALDASDSARFLKLAVKFLQLKTDILISNPQIGGQDECLTQLHNNLEITSEKIGKLRLMVTIAGSMKDKSDKQTVVDMLNEEAADVLNDLDDGRRAIDVTAVYCSGNNVAVAKAQEILRLYNEATTVVMKVRR
jgi:hypothetical protein